MEIVVILALIGIVAGSFSAYVAETKNKSSLGWFILGFFFSLFALLAIAGASSRVNFFRVRRQGVPDTVITKENILYVSDHILEKKNGFIIAGIDTFRDEGKHYYLLRGRTDCLEGCALIEVFTDYEEAKDAVPIFNP